MESKWMRLVKVNWMQILITVVIYICCQGCGNIQQPNGQTPIQVYIHDTLSKANSHSIQIAPDMSTDGISVADLEGIGAAVGRTPYIDEHILSIRTFSTRLVFAAEVEVRHSKLYLCKLDGQWHVYEILH